MFIEFLLHFLNKKHSTLWMISNNIFYEYLIPLFIEFVVETTEYTLICIKPYPSFERLILPFLSCPIFSNNTSVYPSLIISM